MAVDTLHPTYQDQFKTRKIYKDVLGGTLKLRKEKEEYLPKFPSERSRSYDVRLKTATLQNLTEKTQDIMTGLVFQKPITLSEDMPEDTQRLADNFDNRGNDLDAFAQTAFEKSFEGHCGILIDAPTIKAETLEQQRNLNLRPYAVLYDANSIINWHTRINPVTKSLEYDLLVFCERNWRRKNRFEYEEVKEFRVWELDTESRVSWQLWREVEVKDTDEKEIRLIGEGLLDTRFKEIPFSPIYGCKKGDLASKPPLIDLALKNIEHFQTYSDYKSLIHKTNVPMLMVKNLDGELNEIAGDRLLKVDAEGDAKWVEVEGSALSSTRTALQDIKDEMAQMGISLMMATPPRGDTTATEKLIDSIQEMSQLQKQAFSLKQAIERSFAFMDLYESREGAGSIELGANWTQLAISNQELQTFNSMVNDGNLSLDTLLWVMEKSGNLPPNISAEDEKERITNAGRPGSNPVRPGVSEQVVTEAVS